VEQCTRQFVFVHISQRGFLFTSTPSPKNNCTSSSHSFPWQKKAHYTLKKSFFVFLLRQREVEGAQENQTLFFCYLGVLYYLPQLFYLLPLDFLYNLTKQKKTKTKEFEKTTFWLCVDLFLCVVFTLSFSLF